MIIGHYATALIPYQKHPEAPLSLFLVAALLLDFLWLGFALFGLEAPHPPGMFDATLIGLQVEMTWSHDLIPVIGWALLMAAAAFAITRSSAVAMWCGALVVVHEISDWIGGFTHHVYGPESMALGLGLYSRVPELSLLFEAALGVACTWWFVRARAKEGRPVSRRGAITLYSIFIGFAAVQLAFTRVSLGELLGVS